MHTEFVKMTLQMIGKEIEDVDFVVGDNCSTNRSFARSNSLPFIGCYSHRLHLCATKIINEFQEEIDLVRDLMSELNTLKNGIILRKFTNLNAIKMYVQRWSGVLTCLERYFRIEEFITNEACFSQSVYDKLPSRAQHQRLKNHLMPYLLEIKAVSLRLQKENTVLNRARAYFQGFLLKEDLPLFQSTPANNYLITSYSTDHLFESAVIKIQEGREDELSEQEERKVVKFLLPTSVDVDEIPRRDGATLSVAELVDFNMRRKRSKGNSKYRCLDHVIPTSNCCERLFSQCKLVYNDHRRRMLPVNLEIVMYLKANKHLWDATTVEQCKNAEGFQYADAV